MLEFWREIPLEIVFDDEDAKEVGVAAGAKDVPGKCSEAEGRDCCGMREAESVAPAFGEERPEKDGAAGENNGRRAFRKDSDQKDGDVVPKGLDVLEFGSEVAFEIVLDDEDAEEIRVASGTEDVPGQSRHAERGDCGWMKETEGVAPALAEKRPETDRAAAKNYRGGPFGENGKTEKKTEEEGSKGGGGSRRGKGNKGRRSRRGGQRSR